MTHPRRALLSFLVAAQVVFIGLSIAAYRTRPQGLIASDGKQYYSWIRSLVFDRDLDFRNDYALIYPPDPLPNGPLTADGRMANKTSVGVAITELPGFVAGHALAIALGNANGVSAPYQFAVTLWLQLVCLAGLGLLWGALVRLGADPGIAAVGVMSALVATNLIQYVARPAMAHGPGIAITCLTLWLAVSGERPAHRWRIAALGALIGLSTIIRTSNVLLLPFLAPLLWPHLRGSLSRCVLLVGGFVLPLAIQVAFASAQWGHLTFSSYGDEGFTGGVHGIVGSLFTARHGLFVYHPWYLVSLIFCVAATTRRETRALGIAALVTFLGFVIANGTWWSWWFGDGFGNRSFVEVIPALLVPAVLWLSAVARARQTIMRTVVVGAVALTAINLVLWCGYILRRFPPDGSHTVAQAYLWWL